MVGGWVATAIMEAKSYNLPEKKEERGAYIAKFKQEIKTNAVLKKIRGEIKELCKDFSVPGIE